MALASRSRPTVIGSPEPRIAPPLPARSDIVDFRRIAAGMGVQLMPWQDITARYLTATGPDGHLFREVAVVVARQNGKTHLMKPYIIQQLRKGKKIAHIAQTRQLPRDMFGIIASELPQELFLRRRGKGGNMQIVWPRFGTGSEEILLQNGGIYRIAAANRGGARGQSNDIVIIDELREMETDEVIAAAESTLIASPDPQMVYLSNAGSDASVVLNGVRSRAGITPELAYLEWSASPERSTDDRDGWLEANPAIGHQGGTNFDALERAYDKHRLSGTLPIFETENLCRWVPSMRQTLVDPAKWRLCEGELERPRKTFMAVSMSPEGTRASAAIAWQQADGTVAARLTYDVTGNPIDTAALGKDLQLDAVRRRVSSVAFDPMTDAELVKYFPKTENVSGGKWANASSQFVNLVEGGRLRWQDSDAVTDDLVWTSRKEHEESGKYQAVRANDDRPITAALAIIRAVWLASGPRPPAPRIY